VLKDKSQHAGWTRLTFDSFVHFALMVPSLCIAVSSLPKKSNVVFDLPCAFLGLRWYL
jgi:hypothetical protein